MCAACDAWYGGSPHREPWTGWLNSYIYSKCSEKYLKTGQVGIGQAQTPRLTDLGRKREFSPSAQLSTQKVYLFYTTFSKKIIPEGCSTASTRMVSKSHAEGDAYPRRLLFLTTSSGSNLAILRLLSLSDFHRRTKLLCQTRRSAHSLCKCASFEHFLCGTNCPARRYLYRRQQFRTHRCRSQRINTNQVCISRYGNENMCASDGLCGKRDCYSDGD